MTFGLYSVIWHLKTGLSFSIMQNQCFGFFNFLCIHCTIFVPSNDDMLLFVLGVSWTLSPLFSRNGLETLKIPTDMDTLAYIRTVSQMTRLRLRGNMSAQALLITLTALSMMNLKLLLSFVELLPFSCWCVLLLCFCFSALKRLLFSSFVESWNLHAVSIINPLNRHFYTNFYT